MKKYVIPEIEIEFFNVDDIMTGSSESLSWTEQGIGDSLGFDKLMGL